jgi:hypothetical protein
MDQKVEFINEWKSKKYTFQSLCEAYGISRALGYRLLGRFKAQGEKGLEPQSRAPHSVANKTLTKVEMAICDLRLEYSRFGADKILTLLKERFKAEDLPAVSTAQLILKRNGLVKPRKRFRRVEPVEPIFNPKAPNEVWSADFKGKFRLGNGEYCYPLTVADSYSRFVFLAKGMYHPTFGLPERLPRGFPRVRHAHATPHRQWSALRLRD